MDKNELYELYCRIQKSVRESLAETNETLNRLNDIDNEFLRELTRRKMWERKRALTLLKYTTFEEWLLIRAKDGE